MFYLFIAAFLCIVGGGGIVTKSSDTRNGNLLIWAALILLAFWTLANSARLIKTGEIAVPSTFGRINTKADAIKTAGLVFKAPWDDLKTVNIQVKNYVRNSDRTDKNERSGTIYIQQQALNTDASYQYSVNPKYAGLLLTKFGDNWEVQVANAVSQSLRVGGIVLNQDGSPKLVDGNGIETENGSGKALELTLEEAQGSKRTILQKNIEIAYRETLRRQLASAGFIEEELDAIIPGVVTIGETAPPAKVLEAIATVEARKKEVEASALLLEIAKNRSAALGQQGTAVRTFVARSQGFNDVTDFTGSISPADASKILDSLNAVEQTGNIRAAIEKGNIPMMVVPSNNPVAATVPNTTK